GRGTAAPGGRVARPTGLLGRRVARRCGAVGAGHGWLVAPRCPVAARLARVERGRSPRRAGARTGARSPARLPGPAAGALVGGGALLPPSGVVVAGPAGAPAGARRGRPGGPMRGWARALFAGAGPIGPASGRARAP